MLHDLFMPHGSYGSPRGVSQTLLQSILAVIRKRHWTRDSRQVFLSYQFKSRVRFYCAGQSVLENLRQAIALGNAIDIEALLFPLTLRLAVHLFRLTRVHFLLLLSFLSRAFH